MNTLKKRPSTLASTIPLPDGLVNAVTTPFDIRDKVDAGALAAHLEWLWDNGVGAQLVAGTTGEFFSLTREEKQTLLRVTRTHFKGHVMFHVGTSGWGETLELMRYAQDNGADSIACLLPFYLSTLEDDGIKDYLSRLGDHCSCPFVIYNFPRHTQVHLTADIVAQVPHAGIKDSSGNLDLISCTPRYYIGSDRLMLKARANGAAGFVSARSNAYPSVYAAADAAANAPNTTRAQQTHAKILSICDRLSGPRQISVVKAAIARALPGYPTGVRLPLL